MFCPDDENEWTARRTDIGIENSRDYSVMGILIGRSYSGSQVQVHKQTTDAQKMLRMQFCRHVVMNAKARCPEPLQRLHNRLEMQGVIVNRNEPWRCEHYRSSPLPKAKPRTTPSKRAGTSTSSGSGNTSCPPFNSITMFV